MRPVLIVAAAMVLLGPPMTPIGDHATAQPFGGPAAPGRHMEERPFGGPPPKVRSPKRLGSKCKTTQETCELTKKGIMGSKCSCPGDGAAPGKVIE